MPVVGLAICAPSGCAPVFSESTYELHAVVCGMAGGGGGESARQRVTPCVVPP